MLMTMAFLLGFHLYYVVQYEAIFLRYISENRDELVYITLMRLEMSFQHIITFMFCVALLVIAIVLYLAEFYACKYIKSKRAV